jgi:hypothetical protein
MLLPVRNPALPRHGLFLTVAAELDTLSEESYKDSTLIMQLLRDNLVRARNLNMTMGPTLIPHRPSGLLPRPRPPLLPAPLRPRRKRRRSRRRLRRSPRPSKRRLRCSWSLDSDNPGLANPLVETVSLERGLEIPTYLCMFTADTQDLAGGSLRRLRADGQHLEGFVCFLKLFASRLGLWRGSPGQE